MDLWFFVSQVIVVGAFEDLSYSTNYMHIMFDVFFKLKTVSSIAFSKFKIEYP